MRTVRETRVTSVCPQFVLREQKMSKHDLLMCAKFSPQNSIIFVADPDNKYEVPNDTGAALVTHSGSCIAVGALAEMDGETTVSIETGERTANLQIAYTGTIDTPNRKIAVIDVSGKTWIICSVQRATTHVTIRVNDPSEPDRIAIVLDQS